MAWIKVFLIASALVLLVILFRHRQRVALRAGSRVAAIVLFLAAVASIADPDIPQAAAERLGVARGTDLLLYLLVVVFALSTMGLYFRLRDTDHRVRQLARMLAIAEALRREEQVEARERDPGQQTRADVPLLPFAVDEDGSRAVTSDPPGTGASGLHTLP